ncbi:hypothetical protein CRG98_010107 [Punica granatum]|uniref:Uncharacterized protein n=1 Tax=Punica granatum TaxID=22663 RepID=A0A2I0KLZ2_PUNGR|nr:hypothetical protein CRG98_010107 [Punica granatum]
MSADGVMMISILGQGRERSILTVNTPFWPTGFPHKDSRLKLGTLFIARAPGVRSINKLTAPQNGSTGAQGRPGPGNKLQTTFWSSARSPEVRFSDHERFPVNLRVFPRKAETTTRVSEYLTIISNHLKACRARRENPGQGP